MSYITDWPKMIMLDQNYVLSYSHTWTSSFTTVSGSGVEMLSDDDATSLCKSSGSLTTPWIQIAFSTGLSVTGWGVCNHNFRTMGLTNITLQWFDGTYPTGTWRNVDYPGTTQIALSGVSDRDFAVWFNGVTSTHFRMSFSETPTDNIYVGFIFVGVAHAFTRNPSSYVHRRTSGTKYIQSSGGSTHAVLGPKYRQGELEIGWRYAPASDLRLLNGYNLERNDNIMAFIPPEASVNPVLTTGGQPPFFGRIQDVEMRPVQGNIDDSSELYDIFVSMRGAV